MSAVPSRWPPRTALVLAMLALLLPVLASAAGRPRYGGELKVAASGRIEIDPLLGDTPVDSAISPLTSAQLCRQRLEGVQPVWGQSQTLSDPTHLHLELRPPAPAAPALSAALVLRSWQRLFAQPSPYRALLFPLRQEGRWSQTTSGNVLAFELAFAFPDLLRTLCHPALAIPADATGAPLGPFIAAPAGALANPAAPRGRPFLDKVAVLTLPERALPRALGLHQAQVVLGGGDEAGPSTAPALWSTYLAYVPAHVGPGFRAAIEDAVDRADLTRFFVRPPAVPMATLLPPALMPQPAPPPPGRSPASVERRELTLVYDRSNDDQRAVAERLQVKLHDRGYRLALRGVPRAELRATWASGGFDLLLDTVLLPPIPAPALAVVLDLAGRQELLQTELSALGAVPEAEGRDEKTREAAARLLPQVPLIPLYAQALRVQTSPGLALPLDAYGLPVFEDAALAP